MLYAPKYSEIAKTVYKLLLKIDYRVEHMLDKLSILGNTLRV